MSFLKPLTVKYYSYNNIHFTDIYYNIMVVASVLLPNLYFLHRFVASISLKL